MQRVLSLVAFLCLVTPALAGVPVTVNRIAIIGPENPTEIRLEVGGWASAIGVAMGGAVGGALAASKENGQMPILADFRLGDEMKTAITKALEEDGYTIVPEDQADAVLILKMGDCKYVRRVWGLIGPRITMESELRDRLTGKRLFSRDYKYDMHTLGMTGQLTPEDKYGFDTIEDVQAHPDVVAAGLRAALPMIAEDMKAALKKKPAPPQ